MTSLAAPPIAVGVKHRYWRYKDTSAPPVASQYVAVFVDATIPDGSTPYVNHIYGKGTTGKRLWIRSPFYQWIPIPVGIGEDAYLASFNVWDAKKKVWYTPDWVFKNNYVTHFPFDVRVKDGQVYDDRSGLNTNYNAQHNSFSDPDQGFLRLFYAQQRTDPTWRIVDLLSAYPTHSPSTKVHANEYGEFAPRGGRYSTGYTNYYSSAQQVSTPYFVPYWTSLANQSFSDGYDPNQLCRAEYDTYSMPTYNVIPNFKYPQNSSTQVAGMLDLAAMKAQMADRFPQRLPDFTGQYDSIVLHHNQRVFVLGYIDFVIEYGANDNDVADVDIDQQLKSIRFGVYSTTNYPGVVIPPKAPDPATFDPGYAMPYSPRYPADTNASGDLFVQQIGLPGASTPAAADASGNGHFRRLAFRRFIQLNLEGPGEDNIRFSATVDNVPAPGFTSSVRTVTSNSGAQQMVNVPYPTFIRASVQFVPQQILLHYTEPGVDTPADQNQSDFGLGLNQVT